MERSFMILRFCDKEKIVGPETPLVENHSDEQNVKIKV